MVSISSLPNKIWSIGGVTEHLGGINATRQLIKYLPNQQDSIILDLGCGTGFTACLLDEEQPRRILALDLNPIGLASAQKRIAKKDFRNLIELVQTDLRQLPLESEMVDGIIAESILVFCELEAVLMEVHRVLKVNGILADNEMILLKPPSQRLEQLLHELFGIHTASLAGWEDRFCRAGFQVLHSSAHPMNLASQFFSHLQVDGLGNYLKAVVAGLSDRTLWKVFINKQMLNAFLDFRSYIGYGLFILK